MEQTTSIILASIGLWLLVALLFAESYFKEYREGEQYKIVLQVYGIKKGNKNIKIILFICGLFTPLSLYYLIRKQVIKK